MKELYYGGSRHLGQDSTPWSRRGDEVVER
jgi:hypothetical protein